MGVFFERLQKAGGVPGEHAPLPRALLDRGLGVLVEKPLTPTAAEAEALIGETRAIVLTVPASARTA